MPIIFPHAGYKIKLLLPSNSPLFGVDPERLQVEKHGYQNFEKNHPFWWRRGSCKFHAKKKKRLLPKRSCLIQYCSWPLTNIGLNCSVLIYVYFFPNKHSPMGNFASADSINNLIWKTTFAFSTHIPIADSQQPNLFLSMVGWICGCKGWIVKSKVVGGFSTAQGSRPLTCVVLGSTVYPQCLKQCLTGESHCEKARAKGIWMQCRGIVWVEWTSK